MKSYLLKYLFGLVLCSVAAIAPAFAQGGGAIIGGGGNVVASGSPTSTNTAQWTDATHIKGFSQGVFNVRLMYGAVADGSTDNATALTNAFTASNAFTTGIPTVYFDCDTGTTTCQYNYSGSGISPINPLVATTIQCAPGVTLNYTGSAHAQDWGSASLPGEDNAQYSIQGCQLTGGSNFTAGIYVNNYLVNTLITQNVFWNFGNHTYFSIVYNGNDWTPRVVNNYWRDTDGIGRNMIDAHTAQNAWLLFEGNKNECFGAGNCSSVTPGMGLWIFTGNVVHNEIKYHYPAVRLSSCQTCGGGDGIFIENNLFEANSGTTIPAITYGDPGTASVHVASKPVLLGNYFYWPTTGNIPTVGPETASSGLFYLDNVSLIANVFLVAPNSTTPYVQTNGTGSAYIVNNRNNAGYLSQTTTNPMIETSNTGSAYLGVSAFSSGATSIINSLAAGNADGTTISAALYHNVASPRLCGDTSGSGTTQVCITNPERNATGNIIPVAGDEIIYKSTTTNTGDLTVAVNGASAADVRKKSGTTTLSAGDLVAGVYYPMIFDGTFWEIWLN